LFAGLQTAVIDGEEIKQLCRVFFFKKNIPSFSHFIERILLTLEIK
jgi:hypothetical protein